MVFRRWANKSYAVFNSIGKHVLIGVLSLCCSIIVRAGGINGNPEIPLQPDTIRALDLDEVVVSAQRSPVVQSQLMRVVKVITQQEIEQAAAQDIASLLSYVRGVDLRTRGPFGMQSDISLRGGTFDQALILINGVNVTDPQTGHHNLNLPVDIHSVERIEVLQGPGARIFGPNAFNGAINIITREPGTRAIRGALSLGQHAFGAAGLSAGFSALGLRHYFSASGIRSDGHVENTDFKTGKAYYRGQASLAGGKMDLQAGYDAKAFGANSFYSPRFPDQFEETSTLFASLQWSGGMYHRFRPLVYWRRHNDRFELFRHEAPSWYTGHNYHQSDVAGASLNWSRAWGWGISSGGLDYRVEAIISNVLGEKLQVPLKVNGADGVFFTNAYRRSGLSLMAEHSLFRGNFSASGGMLLYLNPELGEMPGLFPGLDLGWQFHPSWRLFASLNRTLRLPGFTDLFYSGPTNTGNPGLAPEQAVFAEAGLKGRWKQVNIEVAVFHRWGRNLIDWVKAPGEEKWRSMNHTSVNISGMELGMTAGGLSIQYGFMYAGKQSGELVSNYALDYLRHKLDLSYSRTIFGKLSTGIFVSYKDRAGGYMLFADGLFSDIRPFDPYWLIDLKVTYSHGPYRFFAEASNLFDTHYVQIANVPQPGRWARMGVVVDLFLKKS
jgi:vitamin B12 transporter